LQQPAQNPQLESLNALVGEWTIEATHPMYPSTVVPGRTSFEWLEGEQFLIQRSRTDHSDFPDSISVIGAPDEVEELSMHYFDSRGVYRVYDMSLSEDVWKISRDAPGFSQRLTATFSDDGNTISGTWQLSRDDSTWDDDLQITFRRVP
jgi:hypothetical protein